VAAAALVVVPYIISVDAGNFALNILQMAGMVGLILVRVVPLVIPVPMVMQEI
jgi:hypothetical protein